MNIVFNGGRLLGLSLILLLVKLLGGNVSWGWVILPIISPLLISVYLLLFTQIRG